MSYRYDQFPQTHTAAELGVGFLYQADERALPYDELVSEMLAIITRALSGNAVVGIYSPDNDIKYVSSRPSRFFSSWPLATDT